MDWLGHASARREFEAFVDRAGGDLFRTAYMLTWDQAAAEDLVQEALLRVARRWDRVRSMEHPLAYARRALISVAIDSAGRRRRQREELDDDELREAPDPAAAEALRAVEDVAAFASAMAQLPVRQRAVVVLRYWLDLPEATVAEILGCSVGTVKSTASRGAARLAGIVLQAQRQHPDDESGPGVATGWGGASNYPGQRPREKATRC
jgi:RNA polymerase sigma-70 factor (sigma-E family)